MIRRHIAAALVAAAALNTASAETCPNGQDVQTGVTIFNDTADARSTYTRLSDGIQISIVFSTRTTRPPLVLEMAHGLTNVRSSDRVSVTYNKPVDSLDSLDVLGRWTSGMIVEHANGGVRRGQQNITYLGSDRATFGACIYDVWRVEVLTVTRDEEGGPESRSIIEKLYAPELGFVVGQYEIRDDGTRVEVTSYNRITAE